jgi:gluconate 5-dehydrogenase
VTDDDERRAHLRLVKDGEAPAGTPSHDEAQELRYRPGQFAADFDLSGRVALVAGGGGALGSAIVAGLSDFGARIAVADIDLDAAKETARLATRQGQPPPIAIRLDITRPDHARAAVDAIGQVAGAVDILVNAVGINHCKPALDYTPAEWQRIIEVNLSGAFYLIKAVGAGMVERGRGRIVHIGSVSSLLGHPNHAPYAASKGGSAILIKVLATEWAKHGVTVNAIGPAYTESALTATELADPATREAIEASIPMGRLGTPEDIVGAAIFLCSDAARFVTGQTLYVDGGRTAD